MSRFDDIFRESLRSIYGSSQPNYSGRASGGGGENRKGGGSGNGGYPVPGNLENDEEERFPFMKEGEAPLAKSPVMDDPRKDPEKGYNEWKDELKEAPKGIPHIEDMKPAEFMSFLKKYRDLPINGGLEISEKVDGSARITFGVDPQGLWVQSKNSPRKYSPQEWGTKHWAEALSAAHRALASKSSQIKKWWDVKGNDVVIGAEVLYTRIPNSIEYGPNVIMIHSVLGPGGVQSDAESRKIANDLFKVTGRTLSDGKDQWKFEYKHVIHHRDVMINVEDEFDSLGDVYNKLKELEPNRLKAAGKGPYKVALERFQKIQKAVAQKLVKQLRKQKSVYGPEGGDVEGLVFRDLENDSLVKLVDKEYFTKLNKFLWHYRELLNRGVKIGDKWEFGILQKFRNAIADDVMGVPVAKTPGFVKALQSHGEGLEYPEEADTPKKKADYLLARYVKDEGLMQGDFVGKFERSYKIVLKEFQKLRKEWDVKKKQDLSFDVKDDQGKTVKKIKMDDIIKQRTDAAFDDMEEFFKGVGEAIQQIGVVVDETTQKVALIKLMMGQNRFEQLVSHLEDDDSKKEENIYEDSEGPGVAGRLSQNTAVQMATVVEKNFSKLKKRGIDVSHARPLGAGGNGVAFDLGNAVLKVTKDASEANSSMVIKGKGLHNVVKIYDVFQFPGTKFFGIWQEKLKPISPADKNQFTEFVTDCEVESGMFSRLWQVGAKWEDIVEYAVDGAKEDEEATEESVDRIRNEMQVLRDKYQMDKMVFDLRKSKVKFRDWHGGNIMLRGEEHVVIDLGVSQSPKQKVSTLETIVSSVMNRLSEGPPPVPADVRKMPMSPGGKHAVGIQQNQAAEILKKNSDKLLKNGINVSSMKPLGQGTRGVAFDVGGKVLKITNDAQEAVAANKLKEFNLKHVAQFFDVFRFRDPDPRLGEIYGILQEKLSPVQGMGKDPSGSDASGEALDLNRAILAFNLQETIAKANGDWKVTKKICQEKIFSDIKRRYPDFETDDIEKKYAVEYATKMNEKWNVITKKFHIDEMVRELSSKGVKFYDYHAGNIMVRPGGGYVLIDIGYSKVAGGKEPPVLESALLPYLDEDVPNRLAAIKAAAKGKVARRSRSIPDAVKSALPLLKKKGIIGDQSPKILGQGAHGIAYDIGTSRVFKVTDDELEAKASNHIKGKKLKHIVNIYDVFRLPDSDFYGIVQEKLKPLSGYDKMDVKLVCDLLQTCKAGEAMLSGDYSKVVSQVKVHMKDPDVQKLMDDKMRSLQFPEIFKELHDNKIEFLDYHEENLMMRGNDYVIIDLGLSRSPGAVPPVLEKIVRNMMMELSGQDYVGVDGNIVNHTEDGAVDRFAASIDEGVVDTVGVTIGRYQPFHRGHAEVIRKLANTHTKTIVLVAGNTPDKKNPFSYETRLKMMKASLPDVWRKIEVYKATYGGKNSGYVPAILSDIIEKGSSLKGDTAVEILVGPDRFEQMKQQLERAQAAKEGGTEGNFDPDLAIVKSLPGIKNDDDSDRISGSRLRIAISKNDRDAVKAMLDPHLVSNQSTFESIFSELKAELQKNVGQIKEDIADFGGEQAIMAVLRVNADKLKAKGIDVQQLRKLGNGQAGIAYDMGSNKVFKVTTSVNEAQSSYNLQRNGQNLKHVVKIFETFRMEDRRNQSKPLYGIVREKLNPLPPQEVSELNDLVDLLRDNAVSGGAPHVLDFNTVVQKMRELMTKEVRRDLQLPDQAPTDVQQIQGNKRELRAKTLVDQKMTELVARLKHYQVDQMMQELKSLGIMFADYKGDNIMKRGGEYVLSDPGGKSNTGEPPFLEHIVETIINEIGVTFNSNTPGSTQSGLRAGSSGWSSPQTMYTDDDVKDFQEEPEEFELWSDKLKGVRTIGEK